MGSSVYALIVTVVVMVGIAVLILLFERRRAREIEADLRRPPRQDGQSPEE